jgi:acid phosphatase (class A)
MDLNQVTYGNPTKQIKQYLEEDSLVDDLFTKLKEDFFPPNDSELVKDELNELVDYVNSISDEENKAFLTRYKAYDRSLSQVIITTFKQRGIDVETLCEDIIKDIRNLIFKLKYFYQRPRPYQLAQYYKLKLFPYNSFSASTPSYPSGHTLEACVILNVISDKYPNEYQFCREMIDDVAYSRLYLGVHFPTDNDFAKEVAKEILKHPKFTKKYGI